MGARQHDHELVSTVADEHVVRAEMLAQDPGHGLQDVIAGEVTVGVVDLLEPVQVEHQQGDRPVLSHELAPQVIEKAGQEPVVVQARTVVPKGELVLGFGQRGQTTWSHEGECTSSARQSA